MTAIIRQWNKKDILKQREHTGYRPGRLAGGYMADLVALHKCVVLCPTCRPKFDATRNGYVIPRNIPHVQGRCDGCKGHHLMNTMFMHHAHIPR